MSVKLNVIDTKKSAPVAKEFDLDFLMDVHGDKKCVADSINRYLARRRMGTASTKLMMEMSGSNAKPFKQKGTGRARQGNKRAVQMRGGRTCFGPLPRDFGFELPKKVLRKALLLALKDKIANEDVLVVNGLTEVAEIKTKIAKEMLQQVSAKKLLIVYKDESEDYNFLMSIRNLANIFALRFDVLNTYAIVNAEKILIDENCLTNLIEVLKK